MSSTSLGEEWDEASIRCRFVDDEESVAAWHGAVGISVIAVRLLLGSAELSVVAFLT